MSPDSPSHTMLVPPRCWSAGRSDSDGLGVLDRWFDALVGDEKAGDFHLTSRKSEFRRVKD